MLYLGKFAMPRSDSARLRDIADAGTRIQNRIKGMTNEIFRNDDTILRAVMFDFAIIGEAAKGVTPATRVRLASAPWKAMAGMRDFVIHQYWGIDSDIVWSAATIELPPLVALIRAELDQV